MVHPVWQWQGLWASLQCVYVYSASVCMGQAVSTQAAADSHPQMSPAAGDASRGMKGWSGKARLVGKHLG